MKTASFAAAFLLLSGAAHADDPLTPSGTAGHFQARLRGVVVLPDPSADIAISGAHIGGTTSISTSFEPEADLSYFITDHIAVEAIAAVTKHTIRNSVAGTCPASGSCRRRSRPNITSIPLVRSGPMSASA